MAAPTQVISLFASESGAILVGTPEGVYLLEGGHRWRRVAARPQTGAHQRPELRFETFSFCRAAPRRVYASSARNVYVSHDGGAEWREVNAPDSPMPIGALSVSAENPDLIYLSRSNLLWRSADGGQSWERLNNPNRWSISEIVAPPHDRLYVATTGEGVYFSPDRGETWQPRRDGLPEGVGAEPVIGIEDLTIHPGDPARLYVVTRFYGVYRSEDGGRSWVSGNAGLPAPFLLPSPNRGIITIAPSASEVLYLALAVPIHSHEVQHSIFRSSDGGRSWGRLAEANPRNRAITSILADPSNPDFIYIGTDAGVITHQVKRRSNR
ncbi:MAG TPA: hypothetical protein VNO70_08405 [Blastocatellia bacterium]|nr:hypothetical protein [Blastocatellia bacterium]